MTLVASFTDLDEQLERLEQALDNVLWAVVQGQPQVEQDHALVDQFEASSTDLSALAKQARQAAQQAQAASAIEPDLRTTRQALTNCQACYNTLWSCFYGESFAFAWRDHRDSARQTGAEWAKWVQGVDDALTQCPVVLYEAAQALFRCWQDLVEWAGLLSISIRITGQEIHAPTS